MSALWKSWSSRGTQIKAVLLSAGLLLVTGCHANIRSTEPEVPLRKFLTSLFDARFPMSLSTFSSITGTLEESPNAEIPTVLGKTSDGFEITSFTARKDERGDINFTRLDISTEKCLTFANLREWFGHGVEFNVPGVGNNNDAKSRLYFAKPDRVLAFDRIRTDECVSYLFMEKPWKWLSVPTEKRGTH